MSPFSKSFACIALGAPSIAFVQDPDCWPKSGRPMPLAGNACNDCDYATLDRQTTENAEFCHAISGVTNGRAALTAISKSNSASPLMARSPAW